METGLRDFIEHQPAVLSDKNAFFEQFGSALLEDEAIDAGNLDRARRASAQSGERLDHVLIKLGLLPETTLAMATARFLGLGIVGLGEIPAEPISPQTIPAQFVRTCRVLPIRMDDETITVAMVDPLDIEPAQAIAYKEGKKVVLRVMTPADFERAVEALYGEAGLVEDRAVDSRHSDASEADVQRLRDIANEAPVIRLVNQIVADAVEARASDIHLEPGVGNVTVRYRIDGSLQHAQTLPTGLRAAVTSRVKIMSKLDIAERRLPQDGRIKMPVRGTDIDFRVSTLPTAFGESIVMRVLDRSKVKLDFHALGFSDTDIALFNKLTTQPNGIVLVTGPTGSGKTTTLYTALKGLNQPDLKLFTVEDPIEYQLAGINQVQIQATIGLDFPYALRSILRQDPDIIMIGEIRDVETARIAIQASLTGHLVLSTLHTNSAAATVTRLLDMGIENYLLASTFNGILAQRLSKRLCPRCSCPHPNADKWIRVIEKQLISMNSHELASAARIMSPVGCESCRNTGYTGRLAIVELMTMDEPTRDLVLSNAPDAELEAAARRSGMRTLYEDGLHKVWMGLTTIEEVLRITRTEA